MNTTWGSDDEDDIFAQIIQETDYYDYGQTNSDSFPVQDDIPTANSEMQLPDPMAIHHQNTFELREEVSTLQRKLEETVQLNTELKNKNYELQGEAGTLRRRLDQFTTTKQQHIFDKMKSLQETKQREIDEREKFELQIESLKAQLHHAKVELDKNQQLPRRQSLGKGVGNPTIVASASGAVSAISPPMSLPTGRGQSGHSSQYSLPGRHDKHSMLNRTSFYAKEVHIQPLHANTIIATYEKEIQTEQIATVSQGTCSVVSSEVVQKPILLDLAFPYYETKTSIRRLITVETQMVQPVIEKTLRYSTSAFKSRIKPRSVRFGLGFEAFDATALMLQWMDEKDMSENIVEECNDIQKEYYRRLDAIFDPANKEMIHYPPLVDDIEESYVNLWPDSEQLTLNSSSDEDNQIESENGTEAESTVIDEVTPLVPHSTLPKSPGSCSQKNYTDSDTSEDEYELENNSDQLKVVSRSTLAKSTFEVVAVGLQHSQMTQKGLRKPLTFFKEYKLKSKLLTDRHSYKYIKEGQPMQVLQEILDGLYEDRAGVWNTLCFVKNELRFLMGLGELKVFEPNRLRVFMTLIIWAKNLWSVISKVEEEEKRYVAKDWDEELFGWTEIVIKIGWRSAKSLIEFCREIRSAFLGTIIHVIESGYFEGDTENYRQVFLMVHNTTKNQTHHNLLNAQLILDILVCLPSSRILPFFCNKTIPTSLSAHLPKCFLLALSNRILDEFKATNSIPLFDRYMDLLEKLQNPQAEPHPLPVRLKRKRKLSENEFEETSEDSMASLIACQSQHPNIFKDSDKCCCGVAAITNFLLILSQIFSLWRERFRDLEFNLSWNQGGEQERCVKNVYTTILIRAFEFVFGICKSSENIGTEYNSEVYTYFWSIVGSYRRFRAHLPLRPDVDAILLHITMDGEEKRRTGAEKLRFHQSLQEEWIELVTQYPKLNVHAGEANEVLQGAD